MAIPTAGDLRERLSLLTDEVAAVSIASLTRTGSTVTVTTSSAHGLTTGEFAVIEGAVPNAYNARYKVTVTGTLTFTFSVSGTPVTPASGTMTVSYVMDAQGGRRKSWAILDTLPAALLPNASVKGETLFQGAIQSAAQRRFAVRLRSGLSPTMRLRWTPSGLADAKLLVITKVEEFGDGRQWLVLTTEEATS